MPQTPRTANDIIVRAFYLIGEFSPNRLPDATDMQEGLYCLNDLFDHFASLGIYIPYIKELTFNLITNQENYTLSNIIPADVDSERIVELEFVNVAIDGQEISYPVRIINRSSLLNNTRFTALQTRPGFVILERQDLYSQLTFYPKPDQPYVCTVRAKFMLDKLELFDNLEEVPPYYFRFLRYALARELLNIYPSANWSKMSEETYQSMVANLKAATDMNLAIYPDNLLMNQYGDIGYNIFGSNL
jgi:hypothetical protein